MTEREFWMLIRRALLMIVKAIESKYSQSEQLEPSDNVTVSLATDD